MAEVSIPFDGRPLVFEVPDGNLAEIISPGASQPLPDLKNAVQQALDNPLNQAPLSQLVRPAHRVLIISDDNTRSTPAEVIIPALLDRLNAAGVKDPQIACLMALGTHRYMTAEEMIAKVGSEVFGRIKVFNHEWRNPEALVDLGKSGRGTPLLVNRAVVEADLLIGLGAVVPHHIPGYSGSSKIIQPGVCGAKTTAETHLLACSGGGDSFLGLEDNPVRRDMEDMADRVGLKTIFNVVLNPEGRVIDLFFGERQAAFRAAVALARQVYGRPYHETPDVVISNSCPCDLDFWQSHKSLYPAQRMVKEGGTIIVCTPAPEGVSPVHSELLEFTSWPSREILAAYGRGDLPNGVAAALAAAWALAREKAGIIMYSPGISSEDKAGLGFAHAPSLAEAVAEALRRQGPRARVTVLTHGPETLPLKTGISHREA